MSTDVNMYNNPTTPRLCYLVGILLIIYLLIAAFAIVIVHLDWIGTFAGDKLLRAHVMCGAFGMLGASTAAIRKYYNALITESTAKITGQKIIPLDWSIGWVYYYLIRPILGSVLGTLVFMLSFIGVLVLSKPVQIQISSEGTFMLYALAFISGFSVSHVLDRVEGLAKQIFYGNSNYKKEG